MPNLQSLQFDMRGWRVSKADAHRVVWRRDSSQDAVSLTYFDQPPRLPVDLGDVDGVRRYYRQGATQQGGGVIEIDVLLRLDLELVRTLFKFPQPPATTVYLGSINIPFADFHYVIKVQTKQIGLSTDRDEIVRQELLEAGEISQDPATGQLTGWFVDPYDPLILAQVLRSRADDAQYDPRFPDHALTRARSSLKAITDSLNLDEELANADAFSPQAADQRGDGNGQHHTDPDSL
ncbi:MAG: hypothetical protein GYB68_02905 [Chloroflexi bacterium]|nr:hypothetical protein [Chloroflexota bacterium]